MHRYYDPARGRFTSPDPAASGTIARPNSWNRYAYTEGDPVNYYDPQGLFMRATLPGDGGGGGYCAPEYSWYDCYGGDYGGSIGGPVHYLPIGGSGSRGNGGGTTSSPDCDQLEIDYITAYLKRYKSPLAAFAATIFDDSQAQGLDDRFIVALAGVESTYGKYLNWGAFNGFNNGAHKRSGYSSWAEAIDDVSSLIGSGANYTPYNSAAQIYSVYEQGDVKKTAPAQRLLDQIYGKQLGGNLSDVRVTRCPTKP